MDLTRLNPPQRAAVTAGDAPLLVLAGAGSGKTLVITYRIARLMKERGVRPDQILAVTFTNKAAREMRARASKLAGLAPGRLDIGTFHGTCGRLLRRYGHHLGLERSYVIYDADDQLSLIKRCAIELKIDPKIVAPRALRNCIEHWKNQGLHPEDVTPKDPLMAHAQRVYGVYQQRCLDANAVDFGDMLLHTVTLLRKNADVRRECRQRWSHILVDEYQDTNRVQYELLERLVTGDHSLTVVGDDDQSIYRWRGADIGNILRFEHDFPGAEVIRLEQNYRSTQTILSAANAVIANNAARKGKTLFTTGEVGDKLTLRIFESERDEGEAIAASIADALGSGTPPTEIAALYRINAQSRPIEDALRRRRVAYAVYGGMRFYDRREVRNALAYLRLVHNPRSEVDFLRVINSPARGIGKTSLGHLADLARGRATSLFEAARLARDGEGAITAKPRKQLGAFVDLIERFAARAEDSDPARLLEDLLDASGYLGALRDENTDEAGDRIANLGELVEAIDEYVVLAEDPSLAGFLEEAALATDIDAMSAASDRVSLMTLHSAKGLEFAVVFMPGMEEGIFPHRRSLFERPAIEEERRLCYVGITRAKCAVHLSAAERRFVFGEAIYSDLSRFVGEVPRNLLNLCDSGEEDDEWIDDDAESFVSSAEVPGGPSEEITGGYAPAGDVDYGAPVARSAGTGSGFAPGMRVFHATFGEGAVVDVQGSGKRQKLTIDFPGIGRKTIIARFVEPR